MFWLRKPIVLCGLLLVLAACESPEEKADAYLASALEFIEQGDTDRALVELRNVFEFVPNHTEARLTMARLMLDAEQYSAAYGQYLRLIEQDPENSEGRIVLAEIAFNDRNWEEFIRHGEEAVRLTPENDRGKAIELGLEYRTAIQEDDGPRAEAIVTRAESLSETLPANTILQQIRMDGYIRADQYDKALDQLELLNAKYPEDQVFYNQKLALLNQIGDFETLEQTLRDQVDRFPDDVDAKSQLVQYFISRQEMDKAEAFLREISDPAAEDPSRYVDLVRFLTELRGVEAGMQALDVAIARNPNPDRFRAMRAMMQFTTGNQEEALAEIEDILARSEPSDQTNDIKILLVRMLAQRGNEVGSQKLVDEVLEADPNHVEALKIRAARQIVADNPDAAIANLRTALDNAPEDVEAVELMSQAYTRTGNHDLARDFMALAVEVSQNAPVQAMIYARELIAEERYLAAEDVLLPALRRQPQNVDLLSMLGRLYMAMEDYGRVGQVVDTLQRLETPASDEVASRLELARLNAMEGLDRAFQFLEEQAMADDADVSARLRLIQVRLETGEAQEALQMTEALVAEDPENLNLKVVLGMVQSAAGDLDSAVDTYRAVLTENPNQPNVWLNLIGLQRDRGNAAQVNALLEEALAANPGNGNLLWLKASVLESEQDFDAAISIYQELYERESSSLIVANNLASLLITYRASPENIDRAWTIARRLRDTEVPHFQDTYGWIAFKRGDPQEALPYLESSAARLVDDPIVQYHLAEIYAALERPEDALVQYRKAVEIAPAEDPREQIQEARAAIARIEASTQDN